jgi:uncharacterized membrane protein YqjE
MDGGAGGRGLLTPLRGLAGAVLALAATRLDLALTELEEQRLHLAESLLWATLSLFLLGVGTVFAGLLLVLLLWDGPRERVLGLLALGFLAAGTGAALAARHRSRSRPPLLGATRSELQQDVAALQRVRERRP